MMNLVICAHPDDEVFAMGGTIHRFAQQEDKFTVLYCAQRVVDHKVDLERREINNQSISDVADILDFSYHILNHSDENLHGATFVKLIDNIEAFIATIVPARIWTHWDQDFNQDHRTVSEAVEIATRRCPATILHFEVPSATENTFTAFPANTFSFLSSENLEAKHKAIESYGSELTPYRDIDISDCYSRYRGLQTRRFDPTFDHAEAFRVVRQIL